MSICYLRFSAEMAGSLPLVNAFLYLARMLNENRLIKFNKYESTFSYLSSLSL